MPSPLTVTGHILGASNEPLASANVIFTLLGAGGVLPRVIGTGAIVNTVEQVVTNASGLFTINLWGNDQITPGGSSSPPQTYYQVSVELAPSPAVIGDFSITGASAIDLDDLGALSPVPYVPATPVPQGISMLGAVSGSVTLPLSSASIIQMTLAGNVTLATGAIPAAGQRWTLWIIQASSASYTVTFPSNIFGGAPVSPLAASNNIQQFFSDLTGSNLYASGPMVSE